MFLRDDLSKLLQKSGFPLRKWASNDATIVPVNSDDKASTHMSLKPNGALKTLGIEWNSQKDSIFSELKLSDDSKQVIKW